MASLGGGLLRGLVVEKNKKKKQEQSEDVNLGAGKQAPVRDAWMTTKTAAAAIRAAPAPAPAPTEEPQTTGGLVGGGPSCAPSTTVVGDGGASWRAKALLRARGVGAGELHAASAPRGVDLFAHKSAARERRRQKEGAANPMAVGEEGDGRDRARRLEGVQSERGSLRAAMLRPDSSRRSVPAATSSKPKEHRADAGRHARAPPAEPPVRDAARVGPAPAVHGPATTTAPPTSPWSSQRAAEPVVPKHSGAARPSAGGPPSSVSGNSLSRGSPSGVGRTGDGGGGKNASAAASLRARLKSESMSTTNGNAEAGGGNMTAAAALRARLMGSRSGAGDDSGRAEADAERLDDDANEGGRNGVESRVEIHNLPLIGPDGRAVPGAFGREAQRGGERGTGVGRRPETHEGGERVRYYADDDRSASLQELMRREKYEGVADYDANFARNVMKKRNFKATDMDVDDEYDGHSYQQQLLYESADGRNSKRKKRARDADQNRQKSISINDYLKLQKTNDSCPRCIGNKLHNNNGDGRFVVAASHHSYLLFPPKGELVPGHCFIVPTDHVTSSRGLDEDAWTEMRNFKKSLLRMFAAEKKVPFFIETCMYLNNRGPKNHTFVEVIPVPAEESHKGPIYFKKALQEVESEWSVHKAKAVIETGQKGLRGSIPENFPYFHVEFGLSRGFAHVIDDETSFKRNFGRNIIIGLLGLPPENMYKRGGGASSSAHRGATGAQKQQQQQQAAMSAFVNRYRDHDWTSMLDA